MREKYKRFYELSRQGYIITRYFAERGARFRIEMSDSRKGARMLRKKTIEGIGSVGWYIDLVANSNFDYFDRNIQRLANDYLEGIDGELNSQNGRNLDDLFAIRLCEEFRNKSDVFEIISDKTGFILFRNGEEVKNWIERFGWTETYMYKYIRHHALRNHQFVNLEFGLYNGVSQSFTDFFG